MFPEPKVNKLVRLYLIGRLIEIKISLRRETRGQISYTKNNFHAWRLLQQRDIWEPFLIQLSWSTMSQSPGGGSVKPCPQLQLIIIFVCLCHLEIWHQKLMEGRGDVPSASGVTLKSCYSPKIYKIKILLSRYSNFYAVYKKKNKNL